VADSVVEHLADQQRALAEAGRVMSPGGHLFISTPNRYSLGPDPQAGIWAGGILPQRWLAAYVRRQGGIPPKRRLLSADSLARLIGEAGFLPARILVPSVPAGQRSHFGRGLRLLIDAYEATRRLSIGRLLLQRLGPLVHAVAKKPSLEDRAHQVAGDPGLRASLARPRP
jgi:SAM-dependent methyltransferase